MRYHSTTCDFTIDLGTGKVEWLDDSRENWRVTVLDTGLETMTGGRLKRARQIIGEETFCLTYGDGLSDIDIGKLIKFHRAGDAWVTVTAVQPPGRFGVMNFENDGETIE